MTWQQFLPLIIVMAVAVIFVWRSSGSKKPSCDGCHCCGEHHHHDDAAAKKESTTP